MILALYRAALCCLLSFVVSTVFIRYGLKRISPQSLGEDRPVSKHAVGLWTGLIETVLTFLLVIESQYTALAIIIAAKLLFRRDRTASAPAHYLLARGVRSCILASPGSLRDSE